MLCSLDMEGGGVLEEVNAIVQSFIMFINAFMLLSFNRTFVYIFLDGMNSIAFTMSF